jgi:hypothetical protein
VRDVVTTLLEVIGLLCIAAGIGAAFALLIGWPAMALAGVVVITGSALITWSNRGE